MKRLALLVVLGLGLALAPLAHADDATPAHAGFVDANLVGAVAQAEALGVVVGTAPRSLVGEAQKTIASSIDRAQAHLGALRAAKGKADAMSKLAELGGHLDEAEAANKKLLQGDLARSLPPVTAHLLAAQRSFGDFSKLAAGEKTKELLIKPQDQPAAAQPQNER